MAAEKEYGVIEKVKSLVSGGAPKGRIPVSGLNLPWLLARSDCAYREMIPLLKGNIFVKESGERIEYYSMLMGMAREIIDALEQIYRETVRSAKGRKVEPDPCVPVLNVICESFKLLHQSAVLSAELQTRKASAEAFAGAGVIVEFNGIDDSLSNTEVEILHNITELLDTIAPAMQRNSDLRKKTLSKNGMECYLRAEKELTLHYSGLSGSN